MLRRSSSLFCTQFGVCRHCHTGSQLDVVKTRSPWNEKVAVATQYLRHKEKQNRGYYGNSTISVPMKLVKLGRIIKFQDDYDAYVEEKELEKIIAEQEFISDRVEVLGPDLAAAHFILNRGGSVKFWRKPGWVGKHAVNASLPLTYVPGFFIEGINARGTDLYYEGLMNICNLIKLNYLSLRGLTNLNDFALDRISGYYGSQLENLDISGCTGITHYGLTCLHRFKRLKMLDVSGIQHSEEFKLTCIMLKDLLPELDLRGVDFSTDDPELNESLAISNEGKSCESIPSS